MGFAGGNNIALRHVLCDGLEYAWLLNNDTEVDTAALRELLAVSEKNPAVGMISSKIYYFGTPVLWYAGAEINPWTGRARARGKNQKDTGEYDTACQTGYATGCSLLVRSKVIRMIGMMRQDYFLYYEETDWNIRAQNSGWQSWYAPKSVVFHKVGQSLRTASNNPPVLVYYNIRNRFVMIQRIGSPLQRISSAIYLHYQLLSQFRMILNRDYQRLTAFRYLFLGFWDSLFRRMGKAPVIGKR